MKGNQEKNLPSSPPTNQKEEKHVLHEHSVLDNLNKECLSVCIWIHLEGRVKKQFCIFFKMMLRWEKIFVSSCKVTKVKNIY